jgi:hypothetical protein
MERVVQRALLLFRRLQFDLCDQLHAKHCSTACQVLKHYSLRVWALLPVINQQGLRACAT